MDTADLDGLTRLMRAEFTAVNLQFTHVLVLRVRGGDRLKARITAVDNGDFPNGMAILDELVLGRYPLRLDAQELRPGADGAGILAAEAETEAAMAALLSEPGAGPRTARHRARARRAREGYPDWLAEERARTTGGLRAKETPRSALVAHLTTLLEQTMAHAFVRWHAGDEAGADAAWRLSGAAMLHAGALTRREALGGALSAPGHVPAARLSYDADAARAHDTVLLGDCARHAEVAAAGEGDTALGRLLGEIARDCQALAGWDRHGPFPAHLGAGPAFESFRATRARFL